MDILDELLLSDSPRKKFYEMLRHAGLGAVEKAMDGFISEYIAMSELLQRAGLGENETKLFEAENGFFIEKSKNDIYIGLTAQILGQEG